MKYRIIRRADGTYTIQMGRDIDYIFSIVTSWHDVKKGMSAQEAQQCMAAVLDSRLYDDVFSVEVND